MASKSCNQLLTDKFPTVFKLIRYRVNASSDFATVTFFIVFKMCRHRVNAVLGRITICVITSNNSAIDLLAILKKNLNRTILCYIL